MVFLTSETSSSSSSSSSWRQCRWSILLILLLLAQQKPNPSFGAAGAAAAAFLAPTKRFATIPTTTTQTTITNTQPRAAVTFLGMSSSSTQQNKPKKKQSRSTVIVTTPEMDEAEKPAEITGAEFFGGRAIKEELYDPVAEEKTAIKEKEKEEELLVYDRFTDNESFMDEMAKEWGKRMQCSINSVLYEQQDDDKEEDASPGSGSIYALDMEWDTPFARTTKKTFTSQTTTPLDELVNAMEFYNRIDVAILSGKTLKTNNAKNKMSEKSLELRWEIALLWPNVWEGRVLLTGTSVLTIDTSKQCIVKQIDQLDNGGTNGGGKDILRAIGTQPMPRFWDLYHIGMTPSAELSPLLNPASNIKKGIFSSYKLYELPPRLMVQPTLLDWEGREVREAQCVPNHAFATVIKTMGPTRQRFVPTSPVEVCITREEVVKAEDSASLSTESSEDKEQQQEEEQGENSSTKKARSGSCSRVTWSIPLPVEFTSQLILPLPGTDPETLEYKQPQCQYIYQKRRLVATLPYGGNPQDEDISKVREELYKQVTQDGHKIKLLEDSKRPRFFFWQNEAKACFTEDGLGMCVYEWRPKFMSLNEVGIELEL